MATPRAKVEVGRSGLAIFQLLSPNFSLGPGQFFDITAGA